MRRLAGRLGEVGDTRDSRRLTVAGVAPMPVVMKRVPILANRWWQPI